MFINNTPVTNACRSNHGDFKMTKLDTLKFTDYLRNQFAVLTQDK